MSKPLATETDREKGERLLEAVQTAQNAYWDALKELEEAMDDLDALIQACAEQQQPQANQRKE